MACPCDTRGRLVHRARHVGPHVCPRRPSSRDIRRPSLVLNGWASRRRAGRMVRDDGEIVIPIVQVERLARRRTARLAQHRAPERVRQPFQPCHFALARPGTPACGRRGGRRGRRCDGRRGRERRYGRRSLRRRDRSDIWRSGEQHRAASSTASARRSPFAHTLFRRLSSCAQFDGALKFVLAPAATKAAE